MNLVQVRFPSLIPHLAPFVSAVEAAQAELSEILKVVSGDNAKRMYSTGDGSAGVMSCGQGVGLAHDMPTVKELFDRIVAEAAVIAQRLAGER